MSLEVKVWFGGPIGISNGGGGGSGSGGIIPWEYDSGIQKTMKKTTVPSSFFNKEYVT